MNAFGASILANNSQSSFYKNESAFSIDAPKKKTKLELKEEAVLAELAGRRKFYRQLLDESDCELDIPGVDTDTYDGPKGSDIELTPADLVVDNLAGSDHEDVPQEFMWDDPNYYEDPAKVEAAFGELALMTESANEQLFTEVNADFNNTLKLFDIFVAENKVRAVNQEALIFASEASDIDKFEQLVRLNEALGEKIKNGFQNVIEAIKRIFKQFSEKLLANFASTKSYLDKYKDIILSKPFDDTKYTSQDLFLGIERLQKAKPTPMLTLANADTSLDSQLDYFIAHKNEFCEAEPVQITKESEIAEVMKKYYCQDGHPKTFTGKEFGTKINEVWGFMYDSKATIRSIEKEIKSIETKCKNLMNQAGVDVPAQPNNTPTTEAAYSYLYEKWFTLNEGVLLELDVKEDPKAGTDDTNKAQTAEQQQQNEKEAAKKNDEDNKKAARTGNSGVIETRCRNYAAVCTTCLKAKMTACEFIRNECMGVIRHHVQRYVGNKAEKTTNDQGKEEQKQQEEQKPQNKARRIVTPIKNAAKQAFADRRAAIRNGAKK